MADNGWLSGQPVADWVAASSSFDLEARTRESLAGRALRHLLLPLSLEEIVATAPGAPRLAEDAMQRQTRSRAVLGGYPSVFLAEHPERELAGLVEAFVVRDVSDRSRIRNVAAFRKVLELAASQIGNLANFSELSKLTNPLLHTIRHWRTKAGAEVDFVIEHQGRLLACEAKAGDARVQVLRPWELHVAVHEFLA